MAEWWADNWRSVVDVVVAAATVAAAMLALDANRRAAKSAEALVRERRIDFQLDVLMQIDELLTHSSSTYGRDARLKSLARLIPDDLLPATTVITGHSQNADGVALRDQALKRTENLHGTSVIDRCKKEMRDEVAIAVRRLLDER